MKVRFDSPQGGLTVEDLWDLPLTSMSGRANLDDIAVGLFKQLKDSGTISFVTETTQANELTQLKFDVVKHIIDVRKAENSAAETAAANRAKKQQLLALVAQKENEQLAGQSIEDLRKMIEELSV